MSELIKARWEPIPELGPAASACREHRLAEHELGPLRWQTAMPDDIREILLDLPLVQTEDRPEGMIVLNAGALPEDRRAEADAFVTANGGLIGQKPMLEVIGGKSPEGGPPAATFYALPPAALVPSAE
jgi:hypothetical protein